MRYLAFALALVSCASLPAMPAPSTPVASATVAASASPESAAALGFDGERAHQHLAYLADPARGGRFTGSPGFEEAAQYVAERFKEIGLEPLGDNGTYFQRFPVQIVDLAGTPTLSRTGADAKTWTHRVDFTESIGGRAGNGSADAKLAVVGGGAATGGQDDFAGVDVKGRIALVTGPTVTGYQENIVQRGGLGILVVGEPTIKYSYIAQQFAQTIPMLVVSETTANELLAPSGKTVTQVRDAVRARRSNTSTLDVGFAVDTNIQMSVPVTPVHQVMASNVVGLLRASGTDAARAVLIGGHLDGVGTDPNGTVFAAANDNASGPSITIEVARVLAAHRSELKRSVIFVAFAGEEEGFLGSESYIARMSSSPGRVESLVAMINLDVIGCCGEILEATNESRALQDRFRAAASRAGVPFNGVGGGGSDQQPFSRRGVPAILVLWSDYILHTTKDTVEKVDLRHLQRAGDVVSAVALDLARGEGP
ncbi:MAG: Zn-dependent exopeptidase M28 [Chloroflexi bacterium]|nr:MAG: Zn-dependent exopeptidase M28 [Chloroflexota bacterium]TMB93590.1 MAG: Zn-dependent exopeptidase M28 [Chloroflexota bacterium]TMC28362.1 MAG: Zn-dependent exopeptidase M28 [Chloroflexota bacterium]TMC34437.1 MAG: Zn-dependent exopeptidase M28 [Chloroflexota bacterium]TMC59095.1 MAG: Zn-dependent exopeptidase M28 [Chloroflexota bacterium]